MAAIGPSWVGDAWIQSSWVLDAWGGTTGGWVPLDEQTVKRIRRDQLKAARAEEARIKAKDDAAQALRDELAATFDLITSRK